MRIVPDELVGRVFGAVRLIALVGVLPGSLAGGWLADRIGVRETLWVSALGFLVVAAVMAMIPALRRERR
jgi:nitrate/nitrite transporter NarK